MRLQEYGVGIFATLSTKSALKKALKKERILVDGKIASTATFIHGGECIQFKGNIASSTRKKLRLNLEVLYEDEYLAIIHKPAGILVSGNTFKTIANALSQNITKSNQSDAVEPQPVHRLDYPTTGALLIGKTSKSILALNQLFEYKKITKTYYAVTIGKMDARGSITKTIDNKEAISTYEVLQTVSSKRFEYLNLVKLSPKTGRRHQLRKHLAFIGNPILGDATYGIENMILKGKGLYLHAIALQFIHPHTNENITIEDQLPAKFEKLFDSI